MFRRSRKALSPVVGSIILIAVTVAASIAVAAWMGALGVGFMQTEQLTITSASFQGTTTKTIQLIAKNTGTSSVTINEVWVNGAKQNYTAQTFQANAPVNVTVSYNWIPNARYEIKLVSANGNQYLYIAEANPQPVNLNPIDTDMSWLTGWNFRKSHLIDGSATTAGTEYQIRIIAQYGIGADNGEIVYLGNKAKTDFGDVRFVQSDKKTLLSYWLESEIDGVNATFWVKMAGNLTVQSQTAYLYYGNSQATSESNGENTFAFFDDFSGNLSKWNKEKNSDHIYINSEHLVLDGGITSGTYGHTVLGSSAAYSNFHDGIIEADVNPSTDALSEIGFRGIYGSNIGYKARWDCRSGSEQPWMKPPYNGWSAFGTSITRIGLSNQWQKVKITVLGSTFKIYNNEVLKSTEIDGQYGGYGEISLQNHYGVSSFFDNVRVRQYVNPEPIHSLWGIEESSLF